MASWRDYIRRVAALASRGVVPGRHLGYNGMAHNMAKLRDLIFFVTRRCDLRCRACFYAGEIDRPAGAEPELSLAEIDAIAARLGRLDSLFISGGEPFLRHDLEEVCAAFGRRCRIRSLHLPSNGQQPRRLREGVEAILRRLPGVRLTLSLSLDGTEAVHDRLRGLAGGFRAAVESARALAPLRREFPALRVGISTVVSRENLDDVLPLAEWVAGNLDVDGHGPSPLRGRPRDPALSPPTAEEWRRLAAELLPYHRRWLERIGRSRLRRELAFNRVRYLYGLYARVLAGGGLPFGCTAGRDMAVLEPEGGVRLCELTPVLGNVRATGLDLAAVLAGKAARRGRRAARSCACTNACFLERGSRSHPLALLRSLLPPAGPAHG
jgi:MoaA/NifB/PqqE/SkfB family radical SAM enzyme